MTALIATMKKTAMTALRIAKFAVFLCWFTPYGLTLAFLWALLVWWDDVKFKWWKMR